ncbi:J domain-containing protein [Azospirillum sp. TSO22-1]|uniref:J domain-containing protein n=1 Tax=Azospirillum sp. TSO22-1 TaxID=716789 RepID=UPI000D61E1EC|nr:J domain-containing protein [Azospirillum sp. TSO22-1]PWC43601.1 molecular chaperone DnaJ [Azospirillum sp. TSO22-1]
MQRNRARLDSRYDFAPRPATRACDHPGCAGGGEYRAPKARDRLNEYFWFCLDHVREYNKAWDYYAGMNADQIESEVRRDTTWQRPTWPLGFWAVQEKFLRDRVVRGFGFEFGREPGQGKAEEQAQRRQAARTPEEEALAVLDLAPPVDFARIKARYRELAKLHHPDANGGDRAAEERLKDINQAYNTLKACYGA